MSAQNPQSETRWSARQLATMALLAALSAALSFIPIPIFIPAASFGITYDPANIPAIIGGLAFGPGAGVLIGIVGQTVHGISAGDPVGAFMNIIAVTGFVIPSALIYRKKKTTARLTVGLIVGCLTSTAVMMPANLLVAPLYYSVTVDMVLGWIIPMLLPMNLMKAVLNAVLSFLSYKSLYRLIER